MPYTYNDDEFYKTWRLEFDREPTQEEASNPAYRDPKTLSETAWNNGGKDRYYESHNADGSPKAVNVPVTVNPTPAQPLPNLTNNVPTPPATPQSVVSKPQPSTNFFSKLWKVLFG